MKTLLMFAILTSLTTAQVFDYSWPTIYTIDVLELPTVPNFLDDYSAPGQIEWNQQVYWELNRLEDLIGEPKPFIWLDISERDLPQEFLPAKRKDLLQSEWRELLFEGNMP